ncbi:MAG: hypothetical protein K9G76_12890 [Bacteroidales bacterium]|nr:hypothetical protein [Bacteroidales bacterium]MCF8405864.1 hypothetical protein [Bacteroidales bacterium]
MKCAFTTATISYLPKAFTLAKTFLKFNENYHFYIFLIDPLEDRIKPFVQEQITYISIDRLEIEGFSEVVNEYNISEISFSLKPALSLWLLETKPAMEFVFYFDADMAFYHDVSIAESMLNSYDLLLTPHFHHPVTDDKIPTELDILRTGIYNMGFAAFRNSSNAKDILRWWKNRVFKYGIENHDLGLTADQMWMNLAPVFFKNVGLIEDTGYNFAYWNVHERELTLQNSKYMVNKSYPLVFVHFADFNPEKPEWLTNRKHFNRILPGQNKCIDQLCADYQEILFKNHFKEYDKIKSAYKATGSKRAWRKIQSSKGMRQKIKYFVISMIYLLPTTLRSGFRQCSMFFIRNIKS